MTLYRNWAIVYNATKTLGKETAERLRGVLLHFGCSAQILERAPAELKGYDAVATIGGDGTILGAATPAIRAGIPVVGINLGKLGYLASVDRNRLEESFEKIVHGQATQNQRAVLELELPSGQTYWALNDIVIKSAEYRLAELSVTADGQRVTEYPCDGLIFATPTGTTAYNLSAGGPILHLGLEGLVMTPVCAHTLTQRSVVFPCRSLLTVAHGRRHNPVHINVDGRTVAEGKEHLPIKIKQAKEKLSLLEEPAKSQFEVLREKLGW